MINFIDNWKLAESCANQFSQPSELTSFQLEWLPAIVPGTVALSLQQAGLWSLTGNKNFVARTDSDFDDKDWWYKTGFDVTTENKVKYLSFTGLASLSEVWLNEKLILSTDNMFLAYKVNVSDVIQAHNELVICFRSLNLALKTKRPRPRWKTRVVEQQQLRWFRTSLLGKIPGWTPPASAVGPWKNISLHEQNEIDLNDIQINTRVEGSAGLVDFKLPLYVADTHTVKAELEINDKFIELKVTKTDQGYSLLGQAKIENVTLWWPHTHGQPYLYDITLHCTVGDIESKYELNPIGFKHIEVDQSVDNFAVRVNNKEIFCRGACWTINDIVSLKGEHRKLEHTLVLMRDAGANMLRIGGTMVYEHDNFYQLCNKLGIMVWQDFMFANMDYPIDDENFRASVELEVEQVVTRLAGYVSVSVFCGGSEIEQQVAMLGLDKLLWQGQLFTEVIPKVMDTQKSEIPYITSSPTGGVLPFHVDTGLSHYYGVGAYLRPVSEVRQHDVKFASECLGFANVPISKTRNEVLGGQIPATHDPRWKARTPRDSGTGWDFEDVRDHYLKELFDLDPIALRCFEPERYLRLSELTTGEVMARVFAEWRSNKSQCRGALVWFLKDFWPGAGWGIIDSHGLPKACYYYLKRAWQPISLHLTNETINGIGVHLVNETDNRISGQLAINLINETGGIVACGTQSVAVNPGERCYQNVDEIMGSFYDVAYVYRFGPSQHRVVAAQFVPADGHSIKEAFLFPQKIDSVSKVHAELTAVVSQISEHEYQLELQSDGFLNTVLIETPGFIADNNYFHMLPGITMRVLLNRLEDSNVRFKGYVGALNLSEDVKIKLLSN